MRVLGIETSCDETAAAVVENGTVMLSNCIASSMDLHAKYGGVVPEIAARMQLETIIPVTDRALRQAKCSWKDIDAIAVTYGAGLGGSLLIGVMTAKTLSIALQKPLTAVNHVMGHVYANFLRSTHLPGYKVSEEKVTLPFLAVILSGGHTQLVLFDDYLQYRLLGRTQDDAVGEAFDKVAKILGLPYPGGPSISALAKSGNPERFKLPKASVSKYDFSFSGLKTAVLRLAQEQIGETYDFPSFKLSDRLSEAQKADIAASFESVAIETIVEKVKSAVFEYKPSCVLLAGGVAANALLRRSLTDSLPCPLLMPDPKLCTDNGAMIATLGCWQLMLESLPSDPYSLTIAPNLSM